MKRVVVIAIMLMLTFSATSTAWAAPGPSAAPQWWFDSWAVKNLWAQGADGRGVTIGEIDSGVNASLAPFADKILSGTDLGPGGGDGRIDHETDPFGHGTAMASLMVAAPGPFGIEGTAPGAKILPIAVPLTGTDDAGSDDHLPEAIRYAADHGAKIINMSIGETRKPEVDTLPCRATEQSAVTYAVSKGVVLVAAGGNSGETGSPVEDPAVCIGVVSVGAIDSAGRIASFSSRHGYTSLVAPGVKIPTMGKNPGTAYQGQGTSQAAAITSAAIALVWSKYPQLTNKQVLQRVFATLDNPQPARDPAYGFGQINPQRAITTDVPAAAAEPVISAVEPYVAALVAASTELPAPAAVKVAPSPPGHFEAGSPPRRITAKLIIASVVSLAGLLALVVLLALAGRRRREPASAGPTEPVQGTDDAAQRGLDDRLADADTPQHPAADLDL